MVEPNTAEPIADRPEEMRALQAELDELAKLYPAPTLDYV